ncbi:hypothetical protein WJX77_007921 [Trebouxia sp. C0004]
MLLAHHHQLQQLRTVLTFSRTADSFVADTLQELGYLLDEQAGEALGGLTEPQLQDVRVKGAGLNVREINALRVRFKPQDTYNDAAWTSPRHSRLC